MTWPFRHDGTAGTGAGVDGRAAGLTSDGIGLAAPPAGPVAARPVGRRIAAGVAAAATGHIFASSSLMDTNAKPTELSAMPYGMNNLSPCFIAPQV